MKKKSSLNYSKFAAMGSFSKGLKNEFETATVKEPSVFEPMVVAGDAFYSQALDHIYFLGVRARLCITIFRTCCCLFGLYVFELMNLVL